MSYNFDKNKPIIQTLEEYRIYIEENLCHLEREKILIKFLLEKSGEVK